MPFKMGFFLSDSSLLVYRKATDFCPYLLRPVFLQCPDSFSLWGKQSISVFALNIPWKRAHRWLSWDVSVMPPGTLCCGLFHFLKHGCWTCCSSGGAGYGQETRRRWAASQGMSPESVSCLCFSFGEKSACVFCAFSVWMFVVCLTCGGQFVLSSCKSVSTGRLSVWLRCRGRVFPFLNEWHCWCRV